MVTARQVGPLFQQFLDIARREGLDVKPGEVAEQALAHSIGTAVERAYRRTDLFEKRRQLMAAWAKFCTAPTTTADVVPIRSHKM